MRSIRSFLVIALLSTITLVNFVAALQGYRASMAEAQRLFDRQLSDIANLLHALPESGGAARKVEQTGQIAFQVWSRDRQLLLHSVNTPLDPIGDFEPGYEDRNFSGHRWRVLTRFHPDTGYWALVAERIDLRFHLAERVILDSVLPIVFGLPVAGLLIWLVVGRGLHSLRQLADSLRHKRADDLSPLPLTDMPDELTPLIRSTNSLLARLQASFERERRFSSDAAHELRTPISALRIHVHNLARELPEQPESLTPLKAGIERMAHLVEQILTLYRTTPDHYPAQFDELDLHELAREVIAEEYRGFAERRQTIELEGTPATMHGDRFALTILLKNLLSNANKYTPEEGRIRVCVQPSPQGVLLRIDDSGPGIPEQERERAFERFYRIGGDRHASTAGGCGLGLSIVEHIAALHGANISLQASMFETGLSVQIHFPAGGEQALPLREQNA